MPYEVKRDFIGYANRPPNPQWPDGARVAVNFVMNYEEGSEPSMQDGEGFTENGLTESHGLNQLKSGRDLAAEGMFEYGSRVGFWRLMRLFQERNLPMTLFACALALERNPEAAAAVRESGFDICCHGWRWVKHFELTEAEEREHIARAVASLERVGLLLVVGLVFLLPMAVPGFDPLGMLMRNVALPILRLMFWLSGNGGLA